MRHKDTDELTPGGRACYWARPAGAHPSQPKERARDVQMAGLDRLEGSAALLAGHEPVPPLAPPPRAPPRSAQPSAADGGGGGGNNNNNNDDDADEQAADAVRQLAQPQPPPLTPQPSKPAGRGGVPPHDCKAAAPARQLHSIGLLERRTAATQEQHMLDPNSPATCCQLCAIVLLSMCPQRDSHANNRSFAEPSIGAPIDSFKWRLAWMALLVVMPVPLIVAAFYASQHNDTRKLAGEWCVPYLLIGLAHLITWLQFDVALFSATGQRALTLASSYSSGNSQRTRQTILVFLCGLALSFAIICTLWFDMRDYFGQRLANGKPVNATPGWLALSATVIGFASFVCRIRELVVEINEERQARGDL